MNIIERLRNLWRIAKEYDNTKARLSADMEFLLKRINERTTVHADIHMKTPSLVIVVGKYRNHDYVRAFPVDHDSLHGLIEYIKRVEPRARVGRMDINPSIKFSSVYRDERF